MLNENEYLEWFIQKTLKKREARAQVNPLRDNVTHMLQDCNCYVIMTQ